MLARSFHPREQLAKRLSCACAALLFCGFAHATTLNALTENLPPLNYEENGAAAGYSTELLQAMLKKAGLTARFTVLPWARAYRTALEQPDTILYSLVRTTEREPLFKWIGPISTRRIYLFRLKERGDIRVGNLDDARRYRIGVVHDMAATKALNAKGFSYQTNLDGAPNDASNVRKLFAHRVDLILALDWSAYYYAKKIGHQASDLVPVLLADDAHSYYFGLSRDSAPETAARLETALDKLRSAGVLKRLTRKYMED